MLQAFLVLWSVHGTALVVIPLGPIMGPCMNLEAEDSNELIIPENGAYDQSNPNSLYNLVPASIKESLLKCQNHFLHDLSTESVRKNIQHTKEYQLVRKLRQSLWLEYTRAIEAKRKMNMTRVWQGICRHSGDFYNIMKQEHFAIFIFTKPLSQDVAEREIFELATERMLEIVSANPYFRDRKTGEYTQDINTYLAKLQFEIFKHIDERIQGGVVKKVHVQSEQKSLNLNVNQDSTTTTVSMDPNQISKLEELNKQLLELRAQTKDIETVAYTVTKEEHAD